MKSGVFRWRERDVKLLKRSSCLVLVLTILITGCFSVKPDLLNERVNGMLNKLIAKDVEGMYELIYPVGMEYKAFLSFVEELFVYFPITEGYTWKLKQYDRYIGVNKKEDWENGQYLVQTGAANYYVQVKWYSNENGSGFSIFQVFNEADWKIYLQQTSD